MVRALGLAPTVQSVEGPIMNMASLECSNTIRYSYSAVVPPSITSSDPVTNDDSSEAKYSTP